jgi:2-methylisocitrate lyase-like PEP mutase family enzyme
MNNYEKFLQLHHQKKPLIIANAWNVKSAQLIEAHGYAAIATSSGAIADSLGYADGEKIPFSELLYVIKRIAACTSIPLSVDLERGYTDDLNELNDHIQKLIDIGVAGINLEDAQGEDIYLKKLTSIKNYLTKNNQQLFINARTDGFLQKLDSPLEITLKRAKLYADAGADGLFVTGVQDRSLVKEITASVTLPVNVVGVPKLGSIEALAESGVKRISMAVLLYKATYGYLEKVVQAIQTEQSFTPLLQLLP